MAWFRSTPTFECDECGKREHGSEADKMPTLWVLVQVWRAVNYGQDSGTAWVSHHFCGLACAAAYIPRINPNRFQSQDKTA